MDNKLLNIAQRFALEGTIADIRALTGELPMYKQVTRIRTIVEALNFEVATPDEAREMLQLKGSANVGF